MELFQGLVLQRQYNENSAMRQLGDYSAVENSL